MLNSYFWDIVIDAFKIGHYLTIEPLKLLIESFANLPADFSSDIGRIKIVTSRSVDNSFDYLRKRASQIFFVNSLEQICQERLLRSDVGRNSEQTSLGDNRVFSIIIETFSGIQTRFALNKKKPLKFLTFFFGSFSYNLLITQIHNHLALLQIIGSILTFNIEPRLSNLMQFFYEDFQEISDEKNKFYPVLNLQLTQYRDLCFAFKQSFR